MPEAVRLLRQEHANMAMLLDVLDRQLAAAQAGGRLDYDIVKAVLDYFLSYPDIYHHPKEDLIYLRLRARDSAKAEGLAELLSGHEELALLTRRFARATVDHILNPGDARRQWFISLGRNFVDTNRRHMAQEEEHFIPLALRVLAAQDWADIDAQITDREDPLFGGTVELRFRDLHQMILDLERDSLESRPA
ncbi:MAG: hemerythrin domain-containing protein [Rhodospirillales bacterium]|nr:hemerythrin domain-containing protein [Rhodospirillales bacterium]